ncbi:MAG: hypothetical protein LC749_16660, partial [Actinobacteria bacterium]|nr:hypothetical protein [Actinomycetota bacterium]
RQAPHPRPDRGSGPGTVRSEVFSEEQSNGEVRSPSCPEDTAGRAGSAERGDVRLVLVRVEQELEVGGDGR